MPINQNQGLFSLLGTTYGGNGQTDFRLPDLRGRVPIHEGSGHLLGESGGEQNHTLSLSELPLHTHSANGTSANGTSPAPTGNVLAQALNAYHSPSNLIAINPGTVTNVGGSQPHENRQPFLTLSFCIALQGIFPSRN
jgi:microcystin-dependent protein